MKIILTLFVFLSLLIVSKIFKIDTEKHKYVVFILPFGIMGLARLTFLFDKRIDFLIFFNVSVFFIATMILISMSKITKFKADHTKEISERIARLTGMKKWVRPIVYFCYLLIQLLIIWKGDEFIFIK